MSTCRKMQAALRRRQTAIAGETVLAVLDGAGWRPGTARTDEDLFPSSTGRQERTDEHRGPRLREIPVRMVWPTLITILALCAGMTGVRQAFEGHFESRWSWC